MVILVQKMWGKEQVGHGSACNFNGKEYKVTLL
jgi:hypothetical protein